MDKFDREMKKLGYTRDKVVTCTFWNNTRQYRGYNEIIVVEFDVDPKFNEFYGYGITEKNTSHVLFYDGSFKHRFTRNIKTPELLDHIKKLRDANTRRTITKFGNKFNVTVPHDDMNAQYEMACKLRDLDKKMQSFKAEDFVSQSLMVMNVLPYALAMAAFRDRISAEGEFETPELEKEADELATKMFTVLLERFEKYKTENPIGIMYENDLNGPEGLN